MSVFPEIRGDVATGSRQASSSQLPPQARLTQGPADLFSTEATVLNMEEDKGGDISCKQYYAYKLLIRLVTSC